MENTNTMDAGRSLEAQGTTTVLSLTSLSELDSVAFNDTTKVDVVATIKGCSFENLARSTRANVDLIAVVDKSGSMNERMPLVKDTLNFMVNQLKEHDRLGLISFDENVEVLCPLIAMDPEGKHRMSMVVDALEVGGQTNTSGAVFQALDMIRRRKDGNDVVSVLLFTDGKANVGVTKPESIGNSVKGFLSQIEAVCSIFTFGYGTEIDPTYLNSISDVGNGMYYHIKSLDAIPLAFSDCLGGLLSIVAQKLTLTVSVPKHHSILDVKSGYSKKVISQSQAIEVTIDDVYSEEQKDILCTVQVPALDHASEKETILENRSEYQRVFASIARDQQTLKAPENFLIDKQKNRLIAANAFRDAADFGKAKKYQEARDVLLVAENQIVLSPSANDPYCRELAGQMKHSRTVFEGESTRSNPVAVANSISDIYSSSKSHLNQRSTHVSQSTYGTRGKSVTSEAYNSYSASKKQ